MSSPTSKKTPGTKKKVDQHDVADKISRTAGQAKEQAKEVVTSQWDYKVALLVITALAFATRFYGISHPDQVVFDEVHFGKVCLQTVHKSPRHNTDEISHE